MLHRSWGFSTHTLVINGDSGQRGWKVILVLHYNNYDIIMYYFIENANINKMYTFFSLNKTSILIQQGCIKLISKVTKDFYFKLMLFNFLVKVSKKIFDEDLIKEMLKYHEILNTGLLMLKFIFANTEINYI